MSAQPRAVQQQPVKDPNVERGRFRVLQRTDGAWFVYDPELPPGRRTVQARTFKSGARGDDPQAAATRFAEELDAAEKAKAVA